MLHLQLANINKEFDQGVKAVQNFSLDVNKGEFVVLMGPSGCGKTSILRVIAGLESPDSGEVLINGTNVNSLSPGKRNIGMVFQNYALYPHKTIYANLAFGMEIRRINKKSQQKAIEEIAARLEINTLLARYPDQISGGQKQRVALARAILRGSDLILFDEPLSNLDAVLRQQMRLEIAALHQEHQFTGIFVTHDQQEAMTLADKIVLLNQGSTIQSASPSELYNQPKNLFAATFTGSPPMNIFNGTVADSLFVTKLFTLKVKPDTRKIGIRPENIKIGQGEMTFEAGVLKSELQGVDWIIYAECDSQKFCCRSEYSLDTGTKHHFHFAYDHVHCFDAAGERIN